MVLLFEIIVIVAPLMFIAVLIMQRVVARGSRFSRVQRAVATLAVLAAVIPGIWLLASGSVRSELRESATRMFILLVIPIAFALPSVFARLSIRTLCTVVGALVLAAFCFVCGLSIGILYLPAAALLLLAGMIGLIPRRAA